MKIAEVVSPDKMPPLKTINEMEHGTIYRNAFIADNFLILPSNMPKGSASRDIISITKTSIRVLSAAAWNDRNLKFLEPLPADTKLELSND